MARGGARPGAGRPPKAVIAETPIRQAERKIRDRLPWIVDRLFELAEGVRVESTGITGEPTVYQKPPDRGACEYLMDRIMGKPAQPVDVRERAQRIADELGMPVEDVLAEAERIATGRR
jgi:hypothetical protein